MVDFRRFITALAVLALFAGLAGAQGIGTGSSSFTCASNVSSTPVVRAEGFTELLGDITLNCSGGTNSALVSGSPIPTVNVQVFLGVQITSRLLSSGGVSEAVLLVDEPGNRDTPATGSGTLFGPGAPQTVCPTPATGCPEVVQFVAATGVGTPSIPAGTLIAVAANPVGTTGGVPNIFQGVINTSGTSVTFFGIPVLPPGSTGITRTFRIANIRGAVNTLGGGGAAGGTIISASIGVSNPSALPITNPTPVVAIVSAGLITKAATPSSIQQCNPQTKAFTTLLSFTEGFGTAFKTRVSPNSATFSGQNNTGGQNVPGFAAPASESGLIIPIASGITAGLADFGTRLKATFSNVPANVRLFVSVTNVTNSTTPAPAPGAGATFSATDLTTHGIGSDNPLAFAQLVVSENSLDQSQFGSSSGIPAVTSQENAPGDPGGTVPVSEILLSGGSGTAVWEVVNDNPAGIDNLVFAVFATTTSSTPGATPGTVTLSFAPTPAGGGVASASLPIPRFTSGTSAAANVLNINVCRTILLYPFVTNQAGFDTGIAIANTSKDVFGTSPQDGSCSTNWFGANAPTNGAPITVASGTVGSTLASVAVPNFQGYMIAVCNFQFAHGFAFISDLGAQKLAMGYLALVVPDPGPGNPRLANPLGNPGSGESNNQ